MAQKIKKLTWSIIFLAGCQGQIEGSNEVAEANSEQTRTVALDGEIAKASYSIGFTLGENMHQRFADSIELEAFLAGASHGLTGAERLVGFEEGQRSLAALNEKRSAAFAAQAIEAETEGISFLAENSKRLEIVTLASGLQYEVLKAGAGPKPGPTDTVVAHYHGTLIDGEVFSSTIAGGSPEIFSLNRVIAGWREALQLMAVGAKWRLYVPPALGYGSRPPQNSSIPANATLIFEVELVEIQ